MESGYEKSETRYDIVQSGDGRYVYITNLLTATWIGKYRVVGTNYSLKQARALTNLLNSIKR